MRSFNDKKAENNAKDPSGEMLVKDPKEYYFSGMRLSGRQYNTKNPLNYGNLSPQNRIYQSFCGDFFSIILRKR